MQIASSMFFMRSTYFSSKSVNGADVKHIITLMFTIFLLNKLSLFVPLKMYIWVKRNHFLPAHLPTIHSQIHRRPLSSCSQLQPLHAIRENNKLGAFGKIACISQIVTCVIWSNLRFTIKWHFTLNRAVGLSPAIDKTIHFPELPDAQLLISGAADEHWQSSSSARLVAGAAHSLCKNAKA